MANDIETLILRTQSELSEAGLSASDDDGVFWGALDQGINLEVVRSKKWFTNRMSVQTTRRMSADWVARGLVRRGFSIRQNTIPPAKKGWLNQYRVAIAASSHGDFLEEAELRLPTKSALARVMLGETVVRDEYGEPLSPIDAIKVLKREGSQRRYVPNAADLAGRLVLGGQVGISPKEKGFPEPVVKLHTNSPGLAEGLRQGWTTFDTGHGTVEEEPVMGGRILASQSFEWRVRGAGVAAVLPQIGPYLPNDRHKAYVTNVATYGAIYGSLEINDPRRAVALGLLDERVKDFSWEIEPGDEVVDL